MLVGFEKVTQLLSPSLVETLFSTMTRRAQPERLDAGRENIWARRREGKHMKVDDLLKDIGTQLSLTRSMLVIRMISGASVVADKYTPRRVHRGGETAARTGQG